MTIASSTTMTPTESSPRPPAIRRKAWTRHEDDKLFQAVDQETPGAINWHRVAARVGTKRSNKDVRKRWLRRIESCRIARGPWLPEEDDRLRQAIAVSGPKWVHVANSVGTRNSEQCSKRWHDVLDPKICRDSFTPADDERLLQEVKKQGRAWSKLASHTFSGRTGIGLKNRYEYLIRQRAQEAVKKATITVSEITPAAQEVPVQQQQNQQQQKQAVSEPIASPPYSAPSTSASPALSDSAFTSFGSDWNRSSFASTISSLSSSPDSFESNPSSMSTSPTSFPSQALLSPAELEMFFGTVLMDDDTMPFDASSFAFATFQSPSMLNFQSASPGSLTSNSVPGSTTPATPTTTMPTNSITSQVPMLPNHSLGVFQEDPFQHQEQQQQQQQQQHQQQQSQQQHQYQYQSLLLQPQVPAVSSAHPINSSGTSCTSCSEPMPIPAAFSCRTHTSSSSVPMTTGTMTSAPMSTAPVVATAPSVASAPPTTLSQPLVLAPTAPGQAWSCTFVNGLPEFRLVPYAS
ncbi:unnamed protein product [Tilletia controversa]|nr:unnamed protein product [Tilletia controversa]